jgi:hypothetical protein
MGRELSIKDLIASTTLKPYETWCKGDTRDHKGNVHDQSGAYFMVSEAEFNEFDRQVTEATDYLTIHSDEISALARLPGAAHVYVDFGIELNDDFIARFEYLPAQFIQAAAQAGIGVQLSQYQCHKDEES